MKFGLHPQRELNPVINRKASSPRNSAELRLDLQLPIALSTILSFAYTLQLISKRNEKSEGLATAAIRSLLPF